MITLSQLRCNDILVCHTKYARDYTDGPLLRFDPWLSSHFGYFFQRTFYSR